MTLTFLGRKYEACPAEVATIPADVTGKYRGIPTQFSRSRSIQSANVQLSYRGISYTK